ncbi:hypothetical protein M0811_05366 [Anaeramoeba ignava]|uniref:Arb2 domain-containing protein n=1 Tax=Anaeramoeba ignava TaxID=1746090 RepID=A0A9Q0LSC0_ANAIG|nr:hypothetical protein M0811_05366 [Anaeramoeba ignava]
MEELKKMGLTINSENRIVYIKNGEIFHYSNGKELQKVSIHIIEYVEEYLKSNLKMEEIMIPFELEENKKSKKVKIFQSQNLYQNEDKLLILVQGSGEVRPGIWTRKFCVTQGLNRGSMIPFVENAIQKGYSVIIANPNEKMPKITNQKVNHLQYIWNEIVMKCPAKDIYIVAHSRGGFDTSDLISSDIKGLERIKKIAFTDALIRIRSDNGYDILEKKSKHWICSEKPLDTKLKSNGEFRVSAGTLEHSESTPNAMESIFKYFDD